MKHAVVIGSGAGGLTSAVLLAERGYRVTVLEQHVRAGGFLHRFFRRGIGYDTGFHYLGSVQPGQLVHRVLGHLGVRDQLQISLLDPEGFDWIRYPGLDFHVPFGIDRFGERIASMFPDQAAGAARYVAEHKAAVAAYAWYNLNSSTPVDEVLRVEGITLSAVLDTCFSDERVRAIVSGQAALYGVPPDEAPFGLHAIVTDHFLRSAATITGGGDRLALMLVKRLRALGGTIRFRTRVTGIEVQDGDAVGVVANDTIIPADLVIANAHPKHVLALLPLGAVRPAYRDRVVDVLPGRAHLGVYMRVRGDTSALKRRNLYRYSSFDGQANAAPSTPDNVPFWFLTAPGEREVQSPGVVLALIQTDWQQVRALVPDAGIPGAERAYDTPAYQAWKKAMLAAALSAFAKDFQWDVSEAEVSTPLTTWRYTGSPNGATYGHYHSLSQMGRYRLPMKVRVKNLLQVGHAVGFPGICGAMMSAYAAVGEVVGAEQLMAELREVQ